MAVVRRCFASNIIQKNASKAVVRVNTPEISPSPCLFAKPGRSSNIIRPTRCTAHLQGCRMDAACLVKPTPAQYRKTPANGPFARKKKMAPAGNECYNVFLVDGFYVLIGMYFIFGVELGD